MSKNQIIILEYIWLDNYSAKQIRNKTRILHIDIRKFPDLLSYIGNTPRNLFDDDLSRIPTWNFKGVHTNQDENCILKPVKLYKNVNIDNGYIVLCEVFNEDNTPHKSNSRHNLENINSITNIKQDVLITEKPIKYNEQLEKNNAKYYGIGLDNRFGKNIIDQHIKLCLDTGIKYISAYSKDYEGYWKYEISSDDLISSLDDIWVSIFLLYRIVENNKLYLKVGLVEKLDIKTTLIIENDKIYETSTYKTDFYKGLIDGEI